MPGYTSEQVATLQGCINAANAALNAGDTQNALNYINLYHSSQTDIRGYATDALRLPYVKALLGALPAEEVLNGVEFRDALERLASDRIRSPPRLRWDAV
jgi:hypothetical protein